MADETTDTKPNTGAEPGTQTDGAGAGTTDTQSDKSAADAPKMFTQEEVNRITGQARRAEREKVKSEEDEATALKQGEFKTLADKYKSERDGFETELTGLRTQNEALTKVLNDHVEAEMKALPEAVRELNPAYDDLIKQLAWLTKAKAKAGDFNYQPKPGNGGAPRPAGQAAAPPSAQEQAAMRAGGGYRM